VQKSGKSEVYLEGGVEIDCKTFMFLMCQKFSVGGPFVVGLNDVHSRPLRASTMNIIKPRKSFSPMRIPYRYLILNV